MKEKQKKEMNRKFLRGNRPGFSKKILEEILHGNCMKESLFIWNQNSQISAGSLNEFLKKYPKVMDAYVEYSIYLCRNNKMTQAQRVYREGRKRTGMTSKRAEELRRKLGL